MSSDNLDLTSKIAIWCRNNLKYIVIGALIGITIPLSWNYYQHAQKIKNVLASDLYAQLIDLATTEEEYKNVADKISQDHKDSIYDVLSKFILSKLEFENKNYEGAKAHLEDIINIDINETYNSLATIKISLINIEEKKYDEALILLENVDLEDAFKPVILELKGDIYKFKGDKEKSLNFYNKALSSSSVDNENLLMKKNSVKK
tara:strand:+ start:329 stop:940 length:612 start_codon:yes stop_codon:yes gene_type:complete